MAHVVEPVTDLWQHQNWQHRKLLYVSLNDLSEPNGPGVNEREFYASLCDAFGDRVHAVIPEPRVACRELCGKNIDHFARQQGRSPLAFWNSQRSLRKLLLKVTRTHDFDLIIIRLKALPLGLVQALREINVPYVVKTVGDPLGLSHGTGIKRVLGRTLLPIQKKLTRGVLQGALAVDCCTPELADVNCRTHRLDPHKVFVVENATNTQRFYPSDPLAARRRLGMDDWYPVLGYVGGHPSLRGGHEILETAHRLRNAYPRIGAVIVGPGGERELRERAAELGLQRCLIPGAVDYATVPQYINALDIGFSLEGLARFQVVGNSSQKVRQYLACGKFVITYIRPDHELIQAGLVEALSTPHTSEIASVVHRLLSQSAVAKAAHAQRATGFVKDKLSTHATLNQRLQLWSSRISSDSCPHGQVPPDTRRCDPSHGDSPLAASGLRDQTQAASVPGTAQTLTTERDPLTELKDEQNGIHRSLQDAY